MSEHSGKIHYKIHQHNMLIKNISGSLYAHMNKKYF
jgi:hypothetical protein